MLTSRKDAGTGNQWKLYWNGSEVAKAFHDKYWDMEVKRLKSEFEALKADLEAQVSLVRFADARINNIRDKA